MNRKIENFFSSLDTLHEASVTDYTQNKIVLSGCVNTFCLTFELSWKAMKYVLESEGVDKGRTGSPKLILMAALTRGLIEDENAWLRMLRLLNDESHHYNQDCAIELCRMIPELLPYFDDLKLRIEYASFAEDDTGRIGFLADGATPLLVHQDGKIIPFVFPKDTIVLDKFLLAEKEQGRRRFTMAHEASHHILSKMYAMPSEGRFHAEYDSERSYSKEELAQMFASVEWQADTMGASLLMPRRIIENALAKYNQSNPIRVYGDNTITSKDKAVIRRMAAYIGVSYTALVIRLRDMGLFEYHNILEYISNELNLGGVSQ